MYIATKIHHIKYNEIKVTLIKKSLYIYF